MSPEQWINKAALYEILAQTYLFTTETLADAVRSGEYAEALAEIVELNGLKLTAKDVVEPLNDYKGRNSDEVFHELRREYTRLFIGAKEPLITPYGGSWYALERGQKPILFVGKESMAVERFMRRCGTVQPEGTNEPLDHIGSELEFLQYLCLIKAEVVVPTEGVEILPNDYDDFYQEHFRWFAELFAKAILEKSEMPFFRAGAQVLLALPQ